LTRSCTTASLLPEALELEELGAGALVLGESLGWAHPEVSPEESQIDPEGLRAREHLLRCLAAFHTSNLPVPLFL
jgi:hypothetical protein